MLAEFESWRTRPRRAILSVAKEALTADWLCDTYYGLVKEYHGDGMVLDDAVRIGGYLPHFYSNFYVYQYATGIPGQPPPFLSRSSNKERPGQNAITASCRGAARLPMDLLKDAGVDMTTLDPVRQALALFERRLDQLEGLLP